MCLISLAKINESLQENTSNLFALLLSPSVAVLQLQTQLLAGFGSCHDIINYMCVDLMNRSQIKHLKVFFFFLLLLLLSLTLFHLSSNILRLVQSLQEGHWTEGFSQNHGGHQPFLLPSFPLLLPLMSYD